MRKIALTTAALLAMTVTTAHAELTQDQIVAMFPGAQKIEIKRGLTTTKVEVIIDGQEVEIYFDNATDEELRRETKTLTASEQEEVDREVSSALKVEVEHEDEDEDEFEDEHEDEHEDGDDHDEGDDDSDDDDSDDDDHEDDDHDDEDDEDDDDEDDDDDDGDDD